MREVITTIALLLSILLVFRIPRLAYMLAALRSRPTSIKNASDGKLPSITVVIPAKGESLHLLKGAIVNVLNQSYKPLEIILILDYPWPKAETLYTMASELENLYRVPVRVILKPWSSRGKASALNLAFRLANGDAIFILDVDDRLCDPHALEKIAKSLSAGLDAVQSLVVGFAPLHRLQAPSASAIHAGFRILYLGRARLGLKTFLIGSGMCVKKSVWKKILFDEEAVVEDVDFAVRAHAAGYKLGVVDARLCMSGAPGYQAFKRQQSRWCFGVAWILRRRLKSLVGMGLHGLEMIYIMSNYFTEPLTALVALILASLSLFVPSMFALNTLKAYTLLLISESLISGLFIRDVLVPRKLRAAGAAGAFAELLQPTFLASFIKGLFSKTGIFEVTPRKVGAEKPSLVEIAYGIISLLVGLAMFSRGFILESLPFLGAGAALAYLVLRVPMLRG